MASSTLSGESVVPSMGAFEAARNDWREGGKDWIEARLLMLGAGPNKLGARLISMAHEAEESGVSPSEAFFAAAGVILDALERDNAGKKLDEQYGVVNP